MPKWKRCHPAARLGLGPGRWKRPVGPSIYDVVVKADSQKQFSIPQEHIGLNMKAPQQLDAYGSVARPTRPQTVDVRRISLLEHGRNSAFSKQFPEFVPREKFIFDRTNLTYYPGFMEEASIKIGQLLRSAVDVVLEFRDARAPFTSSNYFVTHNIPQRSGRIFRVVLLTKADLVEPHFCRAAKKVIEMAGFPCFVICKNEVENVAREVREWVCANVEERWKSLGRTCMVLGVPNVGKSTFINALRADVVTAAEAMGDNGRLFAKDVYREKRTRVTGEPCTTRHVLHMKIAHSTRLYAYDTPGLMLPRVVDREVALKLGCLGMFPLNSETLRYVADYLLFRLNEIQCYQYVDFYSMEKPTNSITELAERIARIALAEKPPTPTPSHPCGYTYFLRAYTQGDLGGVPLDDIPKASELAYRGDIQIGEPPGPWGPAQYPEPLRGLS